MFSIASHAAAAQTVTLCPRNRRPQMAFIGFLSAVLLSLSISVSAPAWAMGKIPTTPVDKATPGSSAAAKSESSAKPKTASTHSNAKEPTPILSDESLKAIQEAAQQMDPQTRASLNQISDAIHQEDKAIFNDLRDEEELSMTDIGMLWEAAVERSGTIRYAIEKLSRRDATGKPVEGDSFSKRVIQNLVHLGGVAGTMWTGTPAGLIGSNMVQEIISGNPQDSALSRVTDADMVILAREVEALQSQLITTYYNYRHAKERYALAQEASSIINKYYDHANTLDGATAETLRPLMQSIYESAKQDEQNAFQAFNSSKAALTMMVGPDALAALDQANAQHPASTTTTTAKATSQ